MFYFTDTNDYNILSELIQPGLLQDMRNIRLFVECLFVCINEDLKKKNCSDLKNDIEKYYNNKLSESFSQKHIGLSINA